MMKKLLGGVAFTVAVSVSGAAFAVPMQIEIWDVFAPVPGQLGNNPVQPTGEFTIDGPNYLDGSADSAQAAIASRAADVIVSVDSSALIAGYTQSGGIGVTLGNETIGGFFNVSGADVTGGNVNFLDNFLLGTVARLTGVVNVADPAPQIDVFSDDGYLVTIGGTEVARAGGLQAPRLDTYSLDAVAGQTGAAFEMIWFEANVVNAALQVEANFSEVPVPAAAWLFGSGLIALAGLKRRKR